MKKILIIILNIVLFSLMFIFMLISPYDYEWTESIKKIDGDKLLVLKMFWGILIVIIPILAIISKPKKKIYYLWYAVLICVVIYKIVFLIWFYNVP